MIQYEKPKTLSQLEAENAKLREEVEQWHRLTAGIELPDYPITEFKPKDLERENAKLRELVRDALMPRLLYGIYRCPDEDMPIGDAIEWADSELRSRAEELGVELEMEV